MKTKKIENIILLGHKLNGGGIQKVLVELANSFQKKGFKVTVYCNKQTKNSDYNLNFKLILTDFNRTEIIESLKQELKNQNTIIFAHTIGGYQANKKLNSLDKNFENMTFNVVHVDYYAMYFKWYRPIKYLRKCLKYRKYFNQSNVISVSNGVQRSLTHKFFVTPKNNYVIYPPSNLKAIGEKANNISETINKDYFVISSRLTERKNVKLAIQAIAKLKSDIDYYLVIIGDGSEKDSLMSLSKTLGVFNKIIFKGWLDNPYPFIKNAIALLSCSNVEGFGLTLVEAMALGVPVISTDAKSGPSEILGEKYKHLIVKRNDPSDLAKKMENILNRKTTINKQGLKEHTKQFGIDKITDDYIKLIHSIEL